MAKQKDIWKFNEDEWKVHITDSKLLKSVGQTFNLLNHIDRFTKYYDGDINNTIVWDILVLDTFIEDVKKYIKDFVW